MSLMSVGLLEEPYPMAREVLPAMGISKPSWAELTFLDRPYTNRLMPCYLTLEILGVISTLGSLDNSLETLLQ